jgi:nucleotide-binding universal stress UspA family protein
MSTPAPPPFRRILVATDLSDTAEAAWQTACALARATGAEVLLLHVFMELPRYRFIEVADLQAAYEAQRQGVEGVLEERVHAAAAGGVKASALLRTGSPVEVIGEAARSAGADLIVLGAHGERGLTPLLIGNVTERVARSAPCAVLIVRPVP